MIAPAVTLAAATTAPSTGDRRHTDTLTTAASVTAGATPPPRRRDRHLDFSDVLDALPTSASTESSITGDHDPVAEGPRWYRSRVRRIGPILGLILPAALGAAAVAVLSLTDGVTSGWLGLVLGVCAAPGLLVIGVPFASSSTYPIGIAISAVIWLAVGIAASRVATRNPVATFTDFWRAYRWLAAAVWVGVGAALVGATALLGRQLV